ncbi:MAG TPA: hypothetical protein VII60_01665 [Acidimicrobiales bacterium]
MAQRWQSKVDHNVLIAGWLPSAVVWLVSPHHLHWNGGDITALILIVAYVVYLVVSIVRGRKKSVAAPVAAERPSVNAKQFINTETGKVFDVDVNSDDVRNSGIIAKEYPPGRIGFDLRDGTADLEDTAITGMDTAIKQTGGELRSKGLSINGEPNGEEKEEPHQ